MTCAGTPRSRHAASSACGERERLASSSSHPDETSRTASPQGAVRGDPSLGHAFLRTCGLILGWFVSIPGRCGRRCRRPAATMGSTPTGSLGTSLCHPFAGCASPHRSHNRATDRRRRSVSGIAELASSHPDTDTTPDARHMGSAGADASLRSASHDCFAAWPAALPLAAPRQCRAAGRSAGGVAAASGRFHQPPPRARKSAPVSAKRLAWACTRVITVC